MVVPFVHKINETVSTGDTDLVNETVSTGDTDLVSTYDLLDSKPTGGGYSGVNFGHLKYEVSHFVVGGGGIPE